MNRTPKILLVTATLAIVGGLAFAPTALSALSGSGNVTDIVQLSTTVNSLPVLSSTAQAASASGDPVASGTAFTMTNSGSNVDTFLRYTWGTVPYYGASSASTSITLRGTAHRIQDLLWFNQESVTAASVATRSDYFSPLEINAATPATRATVTAAGNACTTWGTPPAGFTPVSAGTLVFTYHLVSSPVNDAPVTSDTFHFCLDTSSGDVILSKTASFTGATQIKVYTTNSANAVLNTYRYQMLPNSVTKGNFYCTTGVTGSGTAATPNLIQCQMLPYETLDSTTIKLFALYDPPSFFPSVNQGGIVTYGITGTQWNPYSSTTTNSAS